MGIFDKLDKSKGGHIFLSHSHDDIVEVRKIRNSLEQDGFEPLCFYLKCLTDDDEIEDLIKREIDAREWFIFVDSENARKSRWVKKEREHITKTDKKKIITINLEDRETIEATLHKITHNLRVYISNSNKDNPLARRLKDKLIAKDYLVFFPPDSLTATDNFRHVLADAITAASEEGCVIALLTPHAIQSHWVKTELNYALTQQGNVIPVMVGDFELPVGIKFILHRYQMYRLPEEPSDEDLDQLVNAIGQAIVKK